MRFKKVAKNDIGFLYDLLKEREPKENISHKKMPTYSQHKKFVLSKPYRKWFVIVQDNQKIGAVYLTDINEIGLHLKKEYNKNTIKRQILKKIIETDGKNRYLVNISPQNEDAIKFFKSQDFRLIQYTYELKLYHQTE